MGLDLIVFWILAGLILAAAWAVVNGNDIVHSVVWLSTVFLLTAGLFILAQIEKADGNLKETEKALVSLEIGFSGLDRIFSLSKKEIEKKLKINIPNKVLLVAEAMRKKIKISKIHKLSNIDPWFLEQIKEIVDAENIILACRSNKDKRIYKILN